MLSPEAAAGALQNRLLSALPRAEYARLAPHLETVRLRAGQVLCHAGDAVRHAYFPLGGMLSLLYPTAGGRVAEVGTIGNEGVFGVHLVLRAGAAPYQVVVQLPAGAMRVRGERLREEFDRGGRLQDLVLRYTNALLLQLTQSVTCNRFHTTDERLCRWLLLSRDRTQTDAIPLTQAFLSRLLGVPRTSVTTIAGALQRDGLIRYSRGKIVILDRPRVEAASCECYRFVREELSHFLAA